MPYVEPTLKSVRVRNQWIVTLAFVLVLGAGLFMHLLDRKHAVGAKVRQEHIAESGQIQATIQREINKLNQNLNKYAKSEAFLLSGVPDTHPPARMFDFIKSHPLVEKLYWTDEQGNWIKGTNPLERESIPKTLNTMLQTHGTSSWLDQPHLYATQSNARTILLLAASESNALTGEVYHLIAALNEEMLADLLKPNFAQARLQVWITDGFNHRIDLSKHAKPEESNDQNQIELQIPLFNKELQNARTKGWQLNTLRDLNAEMSAYWNEVAAKLGAFALLTLAFLIGVRHNNVQQTRRQIERERNLQALEESEERLKLATQGAGIGVWEYIFDTDSMHWDTTMCSIYGISSDISTLSSAEWISFLAVQDRERIRGILSDQSQKSETFDVQFRIHRQDNGVQRHIKARAQCFKGDDQTVHRMIGVNQDITEQKEFEQLLKEAEDRFRSAFESAAVGMVMFGLDGSLIQINEALAHMLGYTKAELKALNLDQVTHPQDLMSDERPRKELLNGVRNSYQLEKRFLNKSGAVIWAFWSVSAVKNDRGHNTYFIAQIQNITERKKSEAALIEREHFLRTLSECLPGLVSYWGRDLRCHFANKNYEQWTGLPMSKLRGIHMRKLLGESLYANDQLLVQGVLGGETQRFERRKRKPDGSFADTLVHFIPDVLYGHVEGFFALSTDVTELKMQQRELERMNNQLILRTEQAEAASKAKSTFLANMSHEIRTPMNAIMGMLQLIGDSELNPEQQSYLNKIGSAADVLLNVLNDVLDLSRVEANKLELDYVRFNLDELLGKTIDLFSYRAEEKDIRLYCTKSAECPVSLIGDRLRLAQILNNLLSNALKFTDRGHIHLEVKSMDGGKKLQFSVIDTGSGMTPEQAALLFQPFSQVDSSSSRKFGGAGLGLSICKSLSELMGGNIRVESEPDRGSVFTFTIANKEPSYTLTQSEKDMLIGDSRSKAEPVDLVSTRSTDQEKIALTGIRILIADDHKLNRLVAGEMIRKAGGIVTLANDGQEAIDACKTENFDVILMDLQMPRVDGFQATSAILAMLGDSCPPIIAVTASATEKDRQNILAAGMKEHLVKPFQKEDLVRVLLEQSQSKIRA